MSKTPDIKATFAKACALAQEKIQQHADELIDDDELMKSLCYCGFSPQFVVSIVKDITLIEVDAENYIYYPDQRLKIMLDYQG